MNKQSKRLLSLSIIIGIVLVIVFVYFVPKQQAITGSANLLDEFPNTVQITSTNYNSEIHVTYTIQNVQNMAGWQILLQYDTNSAYQNINIGLDNVFGQAHTPLLEFHDPEKRTLLFSVSIAYNQQPFSGSGKLAEVIFKLTGSVGSVANFYVCVEPRNVIPESTYLIDYDGSIITPLNYDTLEIKIVPEFSEIIFVFMIVTTIMMVYQKENCKHKKVKT